MNATDTSTFPEIGQILASIVLIIMVISGLWQFFKYRRKASIPSFDAEAMNVARASAELKFKYDYEELLPEHFLWALLDKPGKKLNAFLDQQRLDPLKGKTVLEEMFLKKGVGKTQNLSRQPYVSKHVKQVIDQAGIIKERRQVGKINPTDLFEALLEVTVASNETVYDEIRSFMNSFGLSAESILAQLTNTSRATESMGSSHER